MIIRSPWRTGGGLRGRSVREAHHRTADGVAPLLAAIKRARTSVEIAVFRLDRKDVETALAAAAAKGVRVTALIAFANRGGEKILRQLELRFLAAGITVARTSNDLVRTTASTS